MLAEVALAEVALGGIAQERAELHEERPVQPHRVAQSHDLLGGRLLAGKGGGGITGGEALRGEGDETNEDEADSAVQQPQENLPGEPHVRF